MKTKRRKSALMAEVVSIYLQTKHWRRIIKWPAVKYLLRPDGFRIEARSEI
jgi:hypothetical protein